MASEVHPAIDVAAPGAVGSSERLFHGTGTELEGIRRKVFLDRYSVKDPAGNPTERYPEEMWDRVARGIAAVEPTPELRAHWARRFYEAMRGFKFVPGGRILAGAGTGHRVTYYNCFAYETPVHTRQGIVPIGSLSGEHEVLSEGGVYRRAFFRSYGHQRLWAVTLSNGTTLYATAEHQWVVTKPGGGTRRVTTRELKGQRIPINPRPAPVYDAAFAAGVRHGIVFGDGSVQYGKAHVCLFGESEQLASWFDAYGARSVASGAATKAHVRVQGLPAAGKQLPGPEASPSYWRGFVAGLIAAAGHVDARGSVAIYHQDATILARIAEGMASAGLVASGIALVRETAPFDGSARPLYRLQLFRSTLTAEDLLLPSHRQRFEASPKARQATIQVVAVQETDRVEEVYCCVEPETHTITVGHGYLTGQCYVIPSPEDSRGGILDNLKIMTEIMARGGGVGINLSTLRPKGSYIRTVNGTASGPCSWAELYSVATGDVIQQGGSRRGALMLMLNDDHPDIEEFITVKQDRKRILHANLSVCISDAFMEAVKQDLPWNLVWNGEVKKTVSARYLWNLICAAAHDSAEPGLHFIDRSNKRSNTWYYEQLISTNPCGEQPLPAWGVCNLGALNLAAFVRDDGTFDYDGLAEHARVAIRFLDNVVDANEYFIPENAEAQLNTRRTGLGTMGLADALIKLKVRYGSDESLELIERIYRTIRDAAYDMSADLAAEKGAFPKFDRDKYLQGWFIRRLPEPLQEKIYRQGIRNAVVLTQAPTGTTSLLAGVSSGIEPVFDFAFLRRDRTGEHVIYHPLYKAWKDSVPPGTPKPDYFVAANDLAPEEHVRVQAKIQEYTDASISKTVNAPADHTVDQVKKLYWLAYELGLKGITYYRDGSRDAVLYHASEGDQERSAPKVFPSAQPVAPPEPAAVQPTLPAMPEPRETVKPRPRIVEGVTYRVPTPLGTAFVTVNRNGNGQPFEVFCNVGKAGSDTAAVSEAIGRLISLVLRLPSPLSPTERLQAVADQLIMIGSGRQLGLGPNRVRSLPDAIGQVLAEYLGTVAAEPAAGTSGGAFTNGHPSALANGTHAAAPAGPAPELPNLKVGDLCPSCGQATLMAEEGCHKCYSCGHSEC